MQLKLTKEVGTSIHRDTLIKCIATLFASGLITLILISRFWTANSDLAHTAIELIGIFFLLAAFVDTWNTYDEVSSLNRLIGFSLLIIAILNSLHVLLFIDLIPFSSNNVDISMKFWYPGGFFEIILLYIVASAKVRISANKWIGLMIAIGSCLAIGAFIYSVSFVMPVLYSYDRMTREKHIMDAILLGSAVIVAVKTGFRLHGKVEGENEQTILVYTYLALVIFIISRTSFILSNNIHDAAYAYGHVLRLLYSFCLYSAVYKTTIRHPYNQLKDAIEENRIIMNSATIGMINFDSIDEITLVNSHCESLLTTTREELIGTSFEDFAEKYISIPGDELDRINRNSSKGESREFTCICNTGKGTSIKIIVTAIFMKHRKILVLRDAKKQQALENMQLQTQTVLNAIESPVLLMDVQNRIIMCNKHYEDLVDMTSDEVVGKCIDELDKIVRLRVVKPSAAKVFGGCYVGSLEADLTTVNGLEKRVMINSSVIKNVDGEVIGFISVTPDITGIKKEQERMQQQEKLALLGHMAAGLVHEIKNPLASIKGFIQMVKQKTQSEKIREYANIIESAAEDINRIVSDFLMFAKPLPVKMQDISINKLVKSLEIIIGSNAFKNGVVSSFLYCDNEKNVVVDERQIKQVVLNIVDNALHAVNGVDKPTINISTNYNENMDEMQICISDNGIGMSAEQLGKVGTPFYTTKEKGTGLGISICNYIINEHDGSISIESEKSKGTTFTIKLPCKQAAIN